MSSQFEKAYRVTANAILDDKFWNSVFQNIDQRIVGIEDKKASFEAAEQQLLDLGLKRINETIQPAAEKIQRMSELGFMVASSEEVLKPEDGKNLSINLIAGEQAELFAPSPFVALVRRSTPDIYAIGRLLNYDRKAARVDVQIVGVHGNVGFYDDWDIAALAGSVMAMWDALNESRLIRDMVAADRVKVAQDKDNVTQNLNETKVQRQAADKARAGADSALQDFKNLYLGPLKILPDNAPLGALALDIGQIPNVMKQMTDRGWVPSVTVSIGGMRMQMFIAKTDGDIGPFHVDGGFSNGAVFINSSIFFDGHGVKFDTLTQSFTLDVGVKKDTQIVFQGYLANDASDIYVKSEIDALLAKLYGKEDVEKALIELEKRTRVPVGFEGFIDDNVPPDGWLIANGNWQNIKTYPDLFAKIGTRYGGDGVTTFAVPDRRGLFVRAVDHGRGYDPNRVLGTEQGDAIRNITGGFNDIRTRFNSIFSAWGAITGARGVSTKDGTGANTYITNLTLDASRVVPTANENRPRNIALLPIIKY